MNRFFAMVRLTAVPTDGAGDGSLSLQETIEVNASVERAWDVVGNFDDMSWHPAIGSTVIARGQADKPGAARVLTLKEGGGKIHETLNSYDAAATTLSYRITESVLPVRDYSAVIKVAAAGAGKSQVSWSAVFKRLDPGAAAGQDDATAKTVVAGILKSGLQNVKQKLG